MSMQTRDRRSRHTFWIDDRVVDDFAPVMSRYPFGAAALAVYAVLARRADREGDSWPRLELIASESGSSARTAQRAIRLLEVLGLVEVALCYEQGSNRQTSNLYTLLTPPDPLPEIDPDPGQWPPPNRRTVVVRGNNRAQSVTAARLAQSGLAGERPSQVGVDALPEAGTPRQPVTLPSVSLTRPPRQGDTLPHDSLSALEGNTDEGNPRKEGPPQEIKTGSTFTIAEVGLSNRQVWAATLGELARRGDIGPAELESWLRPAALIGRDGPTLIVGAPNAVARDRIASRLLPAVRDALGVAIGAPVAVAVVVVERG